MTERLLVVLTLGFLSAALAGCSDPEGSKDPGDAMIGVDAINVDAGMGIDQGVEADLGARMDAEVCDCPGRQTCDGSGECLEPESCESHEDCLGSRVCKEQACTDGCRESADCPGALSCDTTTQQCVEVSPCVSDASCFDGRLCLDGTCSDPCSVDEDCGGSQTCLAETGRCMASGACTNSEDCPGSQVCDGSECVNRCLETSDCPGSQNCSGGICLEPALCRRDVDCRGERVCVNDSCVNPCMMDGCDRGLTCDVSTGRCVEPDVCANDQQCFLGRRCENGECVDPCLDNADCPGSQRCDENGQCIESGSCQGDESCSPGRVCQNAVCVESCMAVGCPGELTCDEQTGGCQETQPCRRDSQCLEGRYCLEGQCTDNCVESTDCPGALACADGRCVEAGNCFSDEQCLMGRICNDALQCVDVCDTESPCVGTQMCLNGECVEANSCVENRDCVGTRVCHPEAGVCVDACTPGSCIGNQVCNDAGYCSERAGCTSDGSCLGDRVCRLGECRTVRCEASSDCEMGGHCVDWSCVESIPEVCDCGAGYVCQQDVCTQAAPCSASAPCATGMCMPNGRCSECTENADCPGATQCEDGKCVESALCISDQSCLSGRVCNEDNGRCVIDQDCQDDIFEFHGIPSAAIPLTNQVHTGLRICLEEDDWFRFSTDGMAQVIVRHATAGVPLEVSVYGVLNTSNVLDRSTGSKSEAWVSVSVPGEYLIRIARPLGAPGEYSLQIKEADCLLDGYEKPWRNDVASLAAGVSNGRVAGAVCLGDVDWFVLEEERSAILETNSEISFVDEFGEPVVETRLGEPFKVQGDGPYVFDVLPVREPGIRCDAQDTSPIVLGAPQSIGVEDGDDFVDLCLGEGLPEAVFAVDVPSVGQLEVVYEGDALMPTFGIYDDCRIEPLLCGNGLDDRLSRTLDPGRYYVVFQGPLSGTITVNHIEPLGCEDAQVVSLGTPTLIPLGDRLEDFAGDCFFNGPNALTQFTIEETSRVNISLTGTTSMPAQTGLALRNSCDDALTEFACGAGSTDLNVDVLDAGTYSLLVQGQGPGRVTIDATPVQALSFVNSCAGEAVDFASGDTARISGTTGNSDEWSADACGAVNGSDQFFKFSVSEATTVNAALSVEGTLAILSDGCNQSLACGEVSNPVIGGPPSVSAFLFPGTYTLVVDGVDGAFETTVSVE